MSDRLDETCSLADGGPLHQWLQRVHLAGSDPQLLRRRIAVALSVTWMPLLLLSLIAGRAWSGTTSVPFLYDLDVQVRYLVALPLLLMVNGVVRERFQTLLARFLERGIVAADQVEAFRRAVASARGGFNSGWVNVFLAVLVYAIGFSGLWRYTAPLQIDTWYAAATDHGLVTTPAGWWLRLVSLPLFQFLMWRWYLRLFVWWALIWRFSRLELNLQPLHPDSVGGIGFVVQMPYAFIPLLVAQGVIAAGWIGDQILFLGSRLPEFKYELGAATAAIVFLVAGPLLSFTPLLIWFRQRGVTDYGNLAMRYARDFDQKWLRGAAPDEVLGSGDIQSLADLGNSYATLKQMRPVLFSAPMLLVLAVATLAPTAPLLLTMFSAEELLLHALKMLM